MAEYIQNSFDIKYAEAWHKKQGDFSSRLAHGLIDYMKNNNLTIKSCLDVCCGTGEFIDAMKNVVPVCAGNEIAQSMIDYAKQILPDINFYFIPAMENFKSKEKYDLLTCNHDMVNSLLGKDKWLQFFKTCYQTLNKGGHLLFDVYTEEKLNGWTETSYETSRIIDHVRNVEQQHGLCVINETYYMLNEELLQPLYHKTKDILIEMGVPTAEILEMLTKAGFKNIKFFNSAMQPIDDVAGKARIHFWCEK